MRSFFCLLAFTCISTFAMLAQTSTWTFTGPADFPTNISGQINGIGRVTEIRFDPNQPNTIFACSASGGLWKSTNAGVSWTNMGTDGLPQMNLASVCIDYTNSNIIYLGSGDPNYYSTDLGIWKTIDGGLNWMQMSSGLGNLMAVELLMDSLDHLTLLAATNQGIWKTIDGGATWVNKLAGNQFTDMVWKPETGSSTVYASSFNKFFRSTDRGETWTEITSGFAGLLLEGTRIAVSAANPDWVYVGAVNDEGTIFRSVDAGLNFTIQYHNPSWSLTGYDSAGGGQGNYNFCLEANPVNPNQLFLGSHNIMRSNDGGLTWQKLTNWWQTVHTDMHDYAFQPGNPNLLFQANDGGVWLTQDAGVNWIQTSDGLGATENYHAAVSPLYSKLISTGTQDNGELVFIDGKWKTNRGGDWTTRMTMDYTPQKFVYYFQDKERRALPSGSGDEYEIPTVVTANNIKHVFSPDDQNLGYVSGNAIWQTRNLSDASPVWTQIVSATTVIRAMAVCRSRPNIFAYVNSNKLYISHDALSAAPSFTMYTLPVAVSTGDLYLSSKDTNLIFLTAGSKVYRSIDGGANFIDYTGSLPVINHLKIFLDDYSSNQSVYVGNTLGIYYRNQGMADWVNYSGILPTIAPIRDIMWFNDGGVDARLYVAYFGRGVWETKLETTGTCSTPVINGATAGSSGININWSSTGSSVYDVQYRELGTTQWTTISASALSHTITSYVGCTTYEIRVRSRCGSDSSLWSNKAEVSTPTNPLGNDFDQHQDIGNPGAAGSVCYDAINQRYTVYASGEDIWGSQDAFHFLHKKVGGDISISARVKHIGNIYGWAKGGVMIRESLADNAAHSMCVLTPGNGFANQWRDQIGGGSSNVDTPGKAPGWVRLERSGNDFISSFSTDGALWQVFNTVNIPMTDSVYIGLANCSHIDTIINDAVFDHIVINGTALGIEPVVSEIPFRLYPNPAQDILHVQCAETLMKQAVQVRILSADGRSVLQETIEQGQEKFSLHIGQLPAGIYIIEVQGHLMHHSSFIKK